MSILEISPRKARVYTTTKKVKLVQTARFPIYNFADIRQKLPMQSHPQNKNRVLLRNAHRRRIQYLHRGYAKNEEATMSDTEQFGACGKLHPY